MAVIHTFKELIEEVCYSEIFESIGWYVEDNPDMFVGYSNTVFTPEEAELLDLEIKFVNVKEYSNKSMKFDVIVSTDIEVGRIQPPDYNERAWAWIYKWFSVSCFAELENGLRNFQVFEVQVYDKSKKRDQEKLSEYLVPITYKYQLDDIAEDFLRRYYPEALEKPMPIPAVKLAEYMGLKIEEVQLTEDFSIFGQVHFYDSRINYYDEQLGAYKSKKVKGGTIIVDMKTFFFRNIGTFYNTIIHECVHWDMHKKFFELSKIFDHKIDYIFCRANGEKKIENNATPFQWMEWQATQLAPRIQMPASTTKAKIEELIEKNEKIHENENRADIIAAVILELSGFFNVSIASARIRMMELGYKEAEGVFQFVDHHYVRNYCFQENALKRGQTYVIETRDALIQYITNLKFRKLIDSGNYIFVDNHFCINDIKYIDLNEDGQPILTEYARQHIDECCFVFNIKRRKNNPNILKKYSYWSLFRSEISNKIIDAVYDEESEQNANLANTAQDLMDTTRDVLRIKAEMPRYDFGKTLVYHMNRKNCTLEQLEETSLLNYKTIQRMRKGDEGSLSTENIIAACIGLQLYPDFSKDLLKKSGRSFRDGEEKDFIYKMLLQAYYKYSIHYCNGILIENKFEPLGSKRNINIS